jgi:hypothetical protein
MNEWQWQEGLLSWDINTGKNISKPELLLAR